VRNQIVAKLGEGGLGEVYKAPDTRLDCTVAVKVLPAELSADPERRARFEHQARAVASLTHPHICAFYDIGSTGSPHAAGGTAIDYLVMEFPRGETLAERLVRRGPLPLVQALEIAT
jgi:serine/threonine protein kinase